MDILDKTAALERFGGDQELYRAVCELFLKDYPAKMARLKKLRHSDNFEEIVLLAHSAKGSSATIGALRCRDAAAMLEDAARGEQADRISGLVEQLDIQFNLLLEVIEQG
jgi:HPt (histidine-containing phosphotransfer) domain-containing protein